MSIFNSRSNIYPFRFTKFGPIFCLKLPQKLIITKVCIIFVLRFICGVIISTVTPCKIHKATSANE